MGVLMMSVLMIIAQSKIPVFSSNLIYSDLFFFIIFYFHYDNYQFSTIFSIVWYSTRRVGLQQHTCICNIVQLGTLYSFFTEGKQSSIIGHNAQFFQFYVLKLLQFLTLSFLKITVNLLRTTYCTQGYTLFWDNIQYIRICPVLTFEATKKEQFWLKCVEN